MRNSTARNIRTFITASSIAPKQMKATDRRLYRAAKRDYDKTPSNQKDAFFRNLSMTIVNLKQRLSAQKIKTA